MDPTSTPTPTERPGGAPAVRASAFITGASRGLGRALAHAFARAGWDLVLCARGEAGLQEVAGKVRSLGAGVEAGAADVTDAAAVAELVARGEARFGASTALVNNASVLGPRVPIAEVEPERWREVFAVNVHGVHTVSRAVLPGMRRAGRGSIINVSSGVGNEPRERWGAYGVSKWAVEALSLNMALEERAHGIRVNIVDPGRMRTDMRRAAYPDEDPSRPTPPAEVTPIFLWLASPASEAVTGRRFRAQEWPAG